MDKIIDVARRSGAQVSSQELAHFVHKLIPPARPFIPGDYSSDDLLLYHIAYDKDDVQTQIWISERECNVRAETCGGGHRIHRPGGGVDHKYGVQEVRPLSLFAT